MKFQHKFILFFFFYGASTRFRAMASPTFFLHSSLPLASSSEFGAGWLHPSVWHLTIYFVVSPLAFLLQNSFLVPSLGYNVLPFT
jgi:hypothetical protein